jgi:uncharacterized protein YndB with AHSA1/START domain
MTEPLRFAFDVECPPERAYAMWTERASLWWPVAHTVTAEPGLEVVFDPRPGGRIFERTLAGVEIDWGVITVWEPPRRLSYLWHLAADRADATEVEISFIAQDGASTRVQIEHRGWERLGARGPRRRDANRAGWDGVLPAYVAACVSRPIPKPTG